MLFRSPTLAVSVGDLLSAPGNDLLVDSSHSTSATTSTTSTHTLALTDLIKPTDDPQNNTPLI